MAKGRAEAAIPPRVDRGEIYGAAGLSKKGGHFRISDRL